mgnify:CR=1 FL=1|tara:strand:+ start:14 stop:1417 length:1404 start_codon:yes stop_codon:yes gene_type:complete
MADFQEQVMGITGLTIDGSSSAPSRAEFSTFLNDGVIDVTNKSILLNPSEKDNFLRESSEQTSNGFNPGTNKIGSVIREAGIDGQWYPCAKKPIELQYKVTDINSLEYASKFHPVYMITQNRNIHVYPEPTSGGNDGFKVLYVNTSPEETDGTALDHASTGIKWFPNDKIYLVILYASIKSLQSALADIQSNSDITTALTAINTNVDSAVTTIGSATTALGNANTRIGTAKTDIDLAKGEAAEIVTQTDNSGDIATALTAINTAVDRIATNNWGDAQNFSGGELIKVKEALDRAKSLIGDDESHAALSGITDEPSTGTYSTMFYLEEEDEELIASTLSIVNQELQRSAAHISEWKEMVDTATKEANAFAAEVSARSTFTGAKMQAVQAYIGTAKAYLAEVSQDIALAAGYNASASSYIQSAQAFSAEVQTRLAKDTKDYEWYSIKIKDLKNEYNEALAKPQKAQGAK